jgi:hypothetical protein
MPLNQRVQGSNPCAPTKEIKDLRVTHKLQSIAALLAMTKAVVEIFAWGDCKAALAIMPADWARTPKLSSTSGKIQAEIVRNFCDPHLPAKSLKADAFWHRAPHCLKSDAPNYNKR